MKDQSKKDLVYRNIMLVTGILAALLFLLSLISLIEFPGAFAYLAGGMVLSTVVFFLTRTVYRYRETFKVKKLDDQ